MNKLRKFLLQRIVNCSDAINKLEEDNYLRGWDVRGTDAFSNIKIMKQNDKDIKKLEAKRARLKFIYNFIKKQ